MLATSFPIARLRALGCKVSTVFYHDPAAGEFAYSVRLPDGIGQGDAPKFQNMAGYVRPTPFDDRRLMVGTYRPRTVNRRTAQRRELLTARLLDRLADALPLAPFVDTPEKGQ